MIPTADLRQGLRSLRTTPGITAVAVLSLALGIGANAAIFSLVNAVLLRPLPYPEPERLVRLWETFTMPDGTGRGSVSVPNFHDWQQQTGSFEALGAYERRGGFNLSMGSAEVPPQRIDGTSVTGEVFSLLGTDAALGRTLGADDLRPDAARVVVLGHGLWQSAFAGDPDVVGRTVGLEGAAATVVGVMPEGFDFPPRSGSQLWAPLIYAPSVAESRGMHWLQVVGRLRPGVSPERAEGELRAVAARLAAEYPDSQEGRSALLEPLPRQATAYWRPILLTLLGSVGLVLLIACGNVANLLLARTASRRKELALRATLGASRASLARRVLVEATLLAVAGSVLGWLIGLAGLDWLSRLPGAVVPSGASATLDLRIFGFAVAAALLTVLLSGLAPALRVSRTDLQEVLKEARAGETGAGRDRLRAALVVAEVALALVVLVGATLLLRSLLDLARVDSGVQTEQVLTFAVPLSTERYDEGPEIAAFWERLLDDLAALPGVESVGAINHLPLQRWGYNGSFEIVGRESTSIADRPFAEFRFVTPDYFRTLGIPLLEGRALRRADDPVEAAPVALVNRTAAERYWPERSPLGERVYFDRDEPYEVVGVVADVQSRGLDQPAPPELYFPAGPQTRNTMTVAVRTAGIDVEALTADVRRTVAALDSEQPIQALQTMDRVVAGQIADRRFNTLLLGLFALLALVLSMIGVFGVMSYAVTQRRREIGVRLALGADRRSILRLVLGQTLVLGGAGVVLGSLLALASSRVLASQLYGVAPTDPLTFAVAAAGLLGVTVLAGWLPARRATAVDPNRVLREE